MAEILIEKEELLRRHNQIVNVRFPTISVFLFLVLIFRNFGVPFPDILLTLVSLMLITSMIYCIILDQIKNPSQSTIIDSYFAYMCLDLINLSIVIYFLGGVLWIGFIFYSFYLYIDYLIFPRRYSIVLIAYTSILYALVVVSQYFNLYPYELIFSETSAQDTTFLLVTGVAAISFFWFIGYYGDVFYRVLQEKIENLQKAHKALEEERLSLEIRVEARTKEIRAERESLQEKVEERTKELEQEREQLAKKIFELEKFYKLAVGRELKMRELKKTIETMSARFKKQDA